MDKISVIVPVYNVEPYLDKCVQSIVNQTYQNLEIILVDDGSPDNCPAMCDAWAKKDGRIQVIHKKNGGLSDARNAGMEAATGALISFIDSDDWIDLDFYQTLVDALLQTGADLSACDYRPVYGEEEIFEKNPSDLHVCDGEEALTGLISNSGFRAIACNKLYRRELFREIRFPVGRYHEDEFVTYRILDAAEKLVYVDTPLYFYRQRSQSIMDTISPKHLDVLDAYLDRLKLFRNKYPQIYQQDRLAFCVNCIMIYRNALLQDPTNKSVYKNTIKAKRKLVSFAHCHLPDYHLKQWLYIICSKYCLGLFSAILNIRGRV